MQLTKPIVSRNGGMIFVLNTANSGLLSKKSAKRQIIALTSHCNTESATGYSEKSFDAKCPYFKSSFNRPNLYYEVRPKIGAVKEIIKFILSNLGKSGIIYCLSRKKVEELALTLQVNGIKALPTMPEWIPQHEP